MRGSCARTRAPNARAALSALRATTASPHGLSRERTRPRRVECRVAPKTARPAAQRHWRRPCAFAQRQLASEARMLGQGSLPRPVDARLPAQLCSDGRGRYSWTVAFGSYPRVEPGHQRWVVALNCKLRRRTCAPKLDMRILFETAEKHAASKARRTDSDVLRTTAKFEKQKRLLFVPRVPLSVGRSDGRPVSG